MIKINDLKVYYGDLKVIDGFTHTFLESQITTLCGPSGCGKTTLLNAITGLVKIKGDIEVSNKISYIFQEDRLLPWKTVYENVSYVLGDYDQDINQRIMHVLKLVGLEYCKDEYPDALSGGMKRRVSIARAFAYPSDILLMDEPFKGLDQKLKENIMKDFMALWTEDKRTVILVTHDDREAKFLSHQTLILKGLPLEIDYEDL